MGLILKPQSLNPQSWKPITWKPITWGLVVAVITFAADQGFKHALLDVYGFANQAPVRLLPFLDVTLAWNKGVSYSLFTANSDVERYALLGVYAVATLAFIIWMLRSKHSLTTVALGFLIGGASGNALDRVIYGAVADFFHLHFAGFTPFGVFNLADMAIVAGVALLLYESILVNDSSD